MRKKNCPKTNATFRKKRQKWSMIKVEMLPLLVIITTTKITLFFRLTNPGAKTSSLGSLGTSSQLTIWWFSPKHLGATDDGGEGL